MPMEGGQVGMAAIRLMDSLNQVELFQFVQCAVYTDQTQGRMSGACQVEDLDGVQGALGVCQDFDNGTYGVADAVTAILQSFKPLLSEGMMGCLKLHIASISK